MLISSVHSCSPSVEGRNECESVNDIPAVLQPGDDVCWKNGTYTDVNIVISGTGDASHPIVFRASTPGKVIFKGASSITLNGQYIICEGFDFEDIDSSMPKSVLTCAKGSENCRFSECRISGANSTISSVDSKWVSLYGRHNEVSNCSFEDKRNMGCLFVVWLEDGIVPEHKIVSNYFYRPYSHLDKKGKARNGQEAIRIGTSDYSMQNAGCEVRGNWFYACNGEQNEIISSKSCENTYEGNLFEDCVGMFTFRHGNRCVARDNIFISNGIKNVGGVRIIGEDHLVEGNVFLNLTGTGYKSALSIVMGESNAALNGYWTVKNPVIRKNSFSYCKSAIEVNVSSREAQDSSPENVLFEDNVIVSSDKQPSVILVNDTPEGQIVWKNNTLFGCSQQGVNLPQVSEKPVLPDYSSRIQQIRSRAGVSWR